MSNATAVTTHTPINLAPGIDLMVREDVIGEPETEMLIDSLRATLDRTTLIEDIKAAVEALIAGGKAGDDACDQSMDAIMEVARWTFNSTAPVLWDELSAVLYAALETMPLDRLMSVERVATYESARHEGRQHTVAVQS